MKKKVRKIKRRVKKSAKKFARHRKRGVVSKPKKALKRKKITKKHKKTIKKHKKIVRKLRLKKKTVKKNKKHRKPKKARRIKKIKRAKKIRKIKKVRKVKKFKKVKKHRKTKKRTKKIKVFRIKAHIGKGILDQLFESQAKVKLMKLFFRNLDEALPVRDILKMLRVNPYSVRHEMKKLERIGVIRKGKKQGRIAYQLDEDFDFLKELKDLVLKSTISSKEELIRDVKKLGNIKLLVLSGIFKGNEGAEADILVVGDKVNQRKFSTFLKDLESEVGKELKCALMTSKEFNYRYDMYDRFIRDLLKDNGEILFNKLNLW